MIYLLYGILKDQAVIEDTGHASGVNEKLKGVKGTLVTFVADNGLCAAVSELDAEEETPPIDKLVAYIQVVNTLHNHQAIIPMRYGCFLNGIPAIRDVLKDRQRQYHALLDELEGNAEMGIRMIISEKELHLRLRESIDRKGEPSTAQEAARKKDEPTIDGRAYLALRKSHYKKLEEISHDLQALIDRYIRVLSELYIKYRTETDAKSGTIILSIYFLTPKISISRFREAFGEMITKGNDEATLSGPWPPYNFVTTDLATTK